MTTAEIGKGRRLASLSLTLGEDHYSLFFPLLQQGFRVEVHLGCSIKGMLCEQCGLSQGYVEDRIKTIFLDGRPVDDIESAVVRADSTLALSAAMPGLVGATMRRGGLLASFRSEISHRLEKKSDRRGKGMVVVKLFNLLIEELAPTFLEQGAWIQRELLEHFLRTKVSGLRKICTAARVDGKETDLDKLSALKWSPGTDQVLLRTSRDS
jgi:hypothetical protein